jgi:thiol-disulfide isomerase/thioredoxin
VTDSTEEQKDDKRKSPRKDLLRQAVIFLVGLSVVVLYFMGYLRIPDPLEGKQAVAFTLPSLDGKEVNIASHFGKDVIVLDFWAVWCPPCRKSIPALAGLAKEYAGKGVAVYAVNQRDTEKAVRSFLDSAKVDLPVLLDTEGMAGDLYNVSGIPKIVVINRAGIVTFVNLGYSVGSETIIRRAVDKALAGT